MDKGNEPAALPSGNLYPEVLPRVISGVRFRSPFIVTPARRVSEFVPPGLFDIHAPVTHDTLVYPDFSLDPSISDYPVSPSGVGVTLG